MREWSQALNSDDNQAAGRLFAPGARVIQGGAVYELETEGEAVRFNRSLPCSGRVVDVAVEGEDAVTATFELGHRGRSRCDVPPGTLAAARFTVDAGQIVTWEQVPVPGSDNPET
ncbi:MAG: hypothetical protein WD689_01300 [Gaiellaceae bacterium]